MSEKLAGLVLASLSEAERKELTDDWDKFREVYSAGGAAGQHLRDYLMFVNGWFAHRNGGVF